MIPPDTSTNKVLLDPKGLLTQVLSLSAIKMVNDEVSKVYQKTASSSSSSPVEWISNTIRATPFIISISRDNFGKRPCLAVRPVKIKKVVWPCETTVYERFVVVVMDGTRNETSSTSNKPVVVSYYSVHVVIRLVLP